jgi:predicted protein tyrosine phosphatase
MKVESNIPECLRMSRNQSSVVDNKWQGPAVRALFVCSAGILRSPTAAIHFAKTEGWNTRAVGVDHNFALIPVSEALMNWADVIFVMTPDQRLDLKFRFGDGFSDKIFCLNIEDDFGFMDAELVRFLEASMVEIMKTDEFKKAAFG